MNRCWMLGLILLLPLRADGLRIAVASNADPAFRELIEQFEASHAVNVVRVSGATGRHYAQIVNGAPFDLLFAADAETPLRLRQSGHARHTGTYAFGVLALWSPRSGVVDRGEDALRDGSLRRLAIANANTAPYGRAAEEVLATLGLTETLRARLVRGSNVGQTAHFVSSGAADAGFVALSQILPPCGADIPGSVWLPPADSYAPIQQDWALLRDTPAARAFLLFLTQPESRALLERYGYTLPEHDAIDPG
jgi:molybdate transport system substrate-binding protein